MKRLETHLERFLKSRRIFRRYTRAWRRCWGDRDLFEFLDFHGNAPDALGCSFSYSSDFDEKGLTKEEISKRSHESLVFWAKHHYDFIDYISSLKPTATEVQP